MAIDSQDKSMSALGGLPIFRVYPLADNSMNPVDSSHALGLYRFFYGTPYPVMLEDLDSIPYWTMEVKGSEYWELTGEVGDYWDLEAGIEEYWELTMEILDYQDLSLGIG